MVDYLGLGFWATVYLLFVGHFICDYPLQGDFVARAKNFTKPVEGIPWWHPMTAHCYIHSGAVFIVTGSFLLAFLEFMVHFATDCAKCAGLIDYHKDQMIHILWKYVLAVIMFTVIV